MTQMMQRLDLGTGALSFSCPHRMRLPKARRSLRIRTPL